MLRIIDTETCDLQGGIVEIASVDLVNGEIVNPMSDLVCPDRPISAHAMAIHRITPQMVADKPPLEEVIERYRGSEYYVAHNASFDRRVLPEMGGQWLCTLKMARKLWPGRKYGNQALRHSLQLEVETPPGLHAHRALYDCYVTAALLQRIMQESQWSAEQMLQLNVPAPTVSDDVFPFGKYRGQPVAVVARKNPGYLRWMLENLTDLRPAFRQTLQRYLKGQP